MKSSINLILKGIVIGLAKVIPGVSGSLVAVSFGLYERGIDAICNFFKDVKKNLIFLSTVGIGIVIAIILGSRLINYLLSNYYLPTMLLFTGLITGTIPGIIKNTNITTKQDYLIITICFTIVFLISSISSIDTFAPNESFISKVIIFCLGFIDAATMIIPGISGTAIFILIGCYPFILEIMGNLLNVEYITSNFTNVLLFGTGLAIGILLITNIMNYLLKKHSDKIYSVIIGFALSSVVLLFNNSFKTSYTFVQLLISFILCIIGFNIAKKLD